MNQQPLVYIGLRFMQEFGTEHFWKKYEKKYNYKVVSSVIDVRDNFLTLNLAKASKSKEKKSDDSKQVKG